MTREEQRDMACTNWICSQENGTVIMARNVWKAAVEWADSYPNWISVEDQLPEECELVYAIREGNVEPGIYKFMAKDQWEWAPRFIACLDDITHWMPLPQPPRKEE